MVLKQISRLLISACIVLCISANNVHSQQLKPGERRITVKYPQLTSVHIVETPLNQEGYKNSKYRIVQGFQTYPDPAGKLLWSFFHQVPMPVTGMVQYPNVTVWMELGLEAWITPDIRSIFDFTAEPRLYVAATAAQGRVTEVTKSKRSLLPPKPTSSSKILSLGEGTSGFVPYWLSKGVSGTYGVDWVYFSSLPGSLFNVPVEEQEKFYLTEWYEKKYKEHLISGDATQLSAATDEKSKRILKPGSFDLVVSHKLFLHLVDPRDQENLLKEALKMAKPGGYVVISDIMRSIVVEKQGAEAPLIQLLRNVSATTRFEFEIIRTSSRTTIQSSAYKDMEGPLYQCTLDKQKLGQDEAQCFLGLLKKMFPFLSDADFKNPKTRLLENVLTKYFPEYFTETSTHYETYLSDFTLIIKKTS